MSGNDTIWDGITRADTFTEEQASLRNSLADAAKAARWPQVLGILADHPCLANSCRPSGKSGYAPLHQAAFSGAPVDVIEQLLSMGAWRSHRNACGERPLDLAKKVGNAHLAGILAPVFKHDVPISTLHAIQSLFHGVILGRVAQLVDDQALRLPELEPLLELSDPRMWFAVPGMYGGFAFRLEGSGQDARLVSESWCRIEGGSEETHVITCRGSSLQAEDY